MVQVHPTNLLDQKIAPQHEQEHVATDVVSSAPLASRSPTRSVREDVLPTRHALNDFGIRDFTLATGEAEAPVDDGRAEAPLRDEYPPARHQAPAYEAPCPTLRALRGGVGEEKDEKGHGDPSPALLDENDIEDVALAGEIRRRKGWILGVGLGAVVVGRIADGGREQGEERTEREDERVGEQKGGFDGRRQEGRVARGARGRVGSGLVGRATVQLR